MANKVLVTAEPLRSLDHPLLEPLRAAGLTLVGHDREGGLDEAGLIEALEGVVATIAWVEPYTARVLEARPELRIVARCGVGADSVDVDAATRRGVAVAMAYGTNHESVADFAFALMLALGSAIVPQDREVRAGLWQPRIRPGVWGRTVGIVALGRIGRAFATRCRGLGMRILAFDPATRPEEAAALGVELRPLDDLLRESDFVSLHAPLGPSTRHMIDARALSLMKPGAFLINTARGGLVDEAALVRALADGTIAGAGLDVLEEEPPRPGSPLLALDNVLLAPHAAAVDEAGIRLMGEACVDNILRIRNGELPPEGRLLNPEALGRG
jgi:D-3-phosphoglycerate dehydrogenase / 2-oxoglutarate reductase